MNAFNNKGILKDLHFFSTYERRMNDWETFRMDLTFTEAPPNENHTIGFRQLYWGELKLRNAFWANPAELEQGKKDSINLFIKHIYKDIEIPLLEALQAVQGGDRERTHKKLKEILEVISVEI